MAEYTPKGLYADDALSEEDKARVRELAEIYTRADQAGDKQVAALAHEAAENIRAKYGYSGGEDGSEYITLKSAPDAEGLENYLRETYGAKTDARVAELEAAYKASKSDNDAAREALKPEYDALRNRASAENEIEKRNFAERAAAAGMNHGTSSQAELSRSVAYQNALALISAAEAKELGELARDAAKLDDEYRLAIREAVAEGEYELADKLYDEAVRQEKEKREDEATAREDSIRAEEWAREDASEAKKDKAASTEEKYDLAELAAKYGDFSLLRALGIDVPESYEEEYKAKNDGSSGNKSSGSKGSTSSGKASGSSKKAGESTGSQSTASSSHTPEELFELMYENEPNEYSYLTIVRGDWNIPANQIDDIWAEYVGWRNKRIGSGTTETESKHDHEDSFIHKVAKKTSSR